MTSARPCLTLPGRAAFAGPLESAARDAAERLRLLGCPLGQGFMLARPLPAEQAGAPLAGSAQHASPLASPGSVR